MAINFIPNDPQAVAQMPMRSQPARADRKASVAGFAFASTPAEAAAQPGTPEFLHWQCREAALATMQMWESLRGTSLKKWAKLPTGRKLHLRPNHGQDLNAYYDRSSLSFFSYPIGSKVFYAAESTDVVSHECGHALLDTVRPDLWNAAFVETAAFHEAFGDCIALLTALHDRATRVKLLSLTPDLSKPNFVEALAEDLSLAVKKAIGSAHPAAAPRRALNKFKWSLPETLPTNGPPAVLTSEEHSFGRVFVGCFYDVIRLVFENGKSKTEAGLLKAATIAGNLLIEGAENAPISPRFFQAVGRAMALADDRLNKGVNKPHVGKAFADHGIVLASSAMVTPRAMLAGAAPGRQAGAVSLSVATMQDLRSRFGLASGTTLEKQSVRLGDQTFGTVVHQRRVPLDELGPSLKGVVAMGAEATVVGANNHRAALMSVFPEASITNNEVLAFVRTLVDHGRIATNGAPAKKSVVAARPAARGAVANESGEHLGTHRVNRTGQEALLERVRFACGCHAKPLLPASA